MKKILYSFLLILSASVIQANAQYFQATLAIDNTDPVAPKLRILLKPSADLTNFQFDGMEFFLRSATVSDVAAFGAITSNTTSFPGLEITKGGGGADFKDGYGTDNDPSYSIFYFYGKSVGATTAPVTYEGGKEYEVFNVAVSPASVSSFEFAANNVESLPYYLTLSRKSDPGGQPDYTAISSHGDPANNLFYGSGATKSGDNYYQKPEIVAPVKFLSFYALKSGTDAKLTWTVESDNDNKYFDVERSVDGRTYSSFTRVNALKNGKSVNTYETADNGILSGNVVYYRIKQVDENGTVTYSLIRNLKLDKNLAISLYPNPARTTTKLVLDAQFAGKASISIRDVAGKQVQLQNIQLVKGINQHNLNIQTLPAGEYNVTIIGEKLNQTIKLSKIN